MLTPGHVVPILARHALVDPADPVTVTPLGGGVSSIVLLVEAPRARYVLKQPRERFQTADEWLVDTRRAQVEYEVGRFLGRHLGKAIVPLRAFDSEENVLVLDAAPHGWRTWKERLLAGDVREATAKAVARLLAGIHALGADLDDPDQFRHDDLFVAQRIDPYFRTAATRVPETRAALNTLADSFFARADLVHGDVSPKNLFTDPAMEVVRLIDHEVATRGDAAFDVGFCLTHLVLKGIHRPARRDALHAAALTLLDRYQDARPDDETDPLYAREARIVRWLAACLLARAVGKSRVEYLDPDGLATAARLGRALTLDPPRRVGDALARVAA